MVKKKFTFFSLVADIFRDKLKEAGFKVIVRKSMLHSLHGLDVHIQGTRKKHVVSLAQYKYNEGDIAYTITLKSDRLRAHYPIWEYRGEIADPDCDLDITGVADLLVKFMKYMRDIDKTLIIASKIFPKPKYGSTFDPNAKRVSRTSV